jgi:hypothetical protein
VFEFLKEHWPYLANSVENNLIPATNNATEIAIRRFDQYYQNSCGFESIKTERVYLGVFEKACCFTPCSADARARIRGQSPLQLAGYDLIQKPVRGRTTFQEAQGSDPVEKPEESADIKCQTLNPSFLEGSIVPLLSDSSIRKMPMNSLYRGYCLERAATKGEKHVPNLWRFPILW